MDLNPDNDARVGSAQKGAEGGTLSKATGAGDSESLGSLLSTLIPVLVYTAVCLIVFWILRRKALRVYSPRAILRTLFPEQRSNPLPRGWLDWLKPFWREGDVYILNHSSLDAFLFLRFLKVLSLICFFGCCVIWPVLMPIHATGGNGLAELDSATIGNVRNPKFYFAHVIVAWIFFGFILFTIWRESIFYINLRHAYLLAPYYAKRLSSRTVLFQCVPDRYRDAARLRKVFGDSVKHVWIQRDTTDLEHLVEERDETAQRLEKAEIRLIKLGDRARRRGERSAPDLPFHFLPPPESRHNPFRALFAAAKANRARATARAAHTSAADDAETITRVRSSTSPDPEDHPKQLPEADADPERDASDQDKDQDPEKDGGLSKDLPDVNGSVAAQWLPASQRPGHRPIGNFLRRVDTIKWTRNRLKLLNKQINKVRRKLHTAEEGTPLESVFIEFQTQSDAQRAYQTLAHDKPLHMSPRSVGVRPDEVIWDSLRMGWFSRMLRRFGMMGLIIVAILFWSIPSAFVGSLTNISELTETFVFLRWLNLLPSPVIGIIQGFVPALALSLLMAIVPWLLRGCARVAGEPSLSGIELYVQSFYFAFQVVQVFLVTTISSAASAAFQEVLQDPLSAKDLLSENLPKASNFYLSYILVQCLAVGASALLRLWDLIQHGIMARYIQNPRAKWRVWRRVRPIHWGGWFPVFTNMGVIAISYSCIAPVVLGFATVGLYVIYLIHKYNLLFVDDSSIDTRGLVYPRALKQLLIGLYLAEICLVGLFVLKDAFIPMVLMVIFLVFTVLFHFSISDALAPLLSNLPRTLALENEELMNGGDLLADNIGDPPPLSGSNNEPAASVPLLGTTIPGIDDEEEEEEEDQTTHETTGSRSMGLEGGRPLAKIIGTISWATYVRFVTDILHKIGLGPVLARFDAIIHPEYRPDPNPVLRFLHPSTFDSFAHLRTWMPADLPDPSSTYPSDYIYKTYYPPEMWTPPPRLWIPRDEGGISAQEVEHCKRFGKTEASDEGAWLDEKGNITCEVERAPFWDERVLY